MVRRCGYTAKSKWTLKQHQLSFHNVPQPIFKCEFPQCSYQTARRGNLNIHKRRHESTLEKRRPYACTFENCGYRAGDTSALRRHVRAKHSKLRARDFHCTLCPGRFYTAAILRKHITTHVREEQYKCSHCEFLTHSHDSLLGHQKSFHEKGARKIKCCFPECNYSTSYSSSLKNHSRTHETDPEVKRPFPCNIPGCSYRSTTTSALRYHILARHNPNRPRNFSCTLCPKAFYRNPELTKHINGVHVKEETYRCEKELAHSYSTTTEDHGNGGAIQVVQESASGFLSVEAGNKDSRQDGHTPSFMLNSAQFQVPIVVVQKINLEVL